MTANLTAAMGGFFLSLFFFGGLWWTIKTAFGSKQPGLWFAVGFLVRMSVVITGFFWLSKGRWQLLLLCLAGFLAGRSLFLLYRPKQGNQDGSLNHTRTSDGEKRVFPDSLLGNRDARG